MTTRIIHILLGDKPDWAQPRRGDQTKWRPDSWLVAKLKTLLSDSYHRGCGGYFKVTGTSGLFTHTEHLRCDRCGEQTSVGYSPL